MKYAWMTLLLLACDVRGENPPPAVVAGRYEANCAYCHEAGAADAPRRGDEGDWARRRARGFDVLLDRAKKGTVAMPPKGLCYDCSDAELTTLVKFVSGSD